MQAREEAGKNPESVVAQHKSGDVRHSPRLSQSVVGDHVAVEVVGADLLVAVHVADLPLPRACHLLHLGGKLALVEQGAQAPHRLLLVLGLGPLLLALNHSTWRLEEAVIDIIRIICEDISISLHPQTVGRQSLFGKAEIWRLRIFNG